MNEYFATFIAQDRADAMRFVFAPELMGTIYEIEEIVRKYRKYEGDAGEALRQIQRELAESPHRWME